MAMRALQKPAVQNTAVVAGTQSQVAVRPRIPAEVMADTTVVVGAVDIRQEAVDQRALLAEVAYMGRPVVHLIVGTSRLFRHSPRAMRQLVFLMAMAESK